MQKGKDKKKQQPMITQKAQPGLEFRMDPKPEFESSKVKNKLFNKAAIITGSDSGIGRAVRKLDTIVNNAAVQFPQEDITKISKQQLYKTLRQIYSHIFI